MCGYSALFRREKTSHTDLTQIGPYSPSTLARSPLPPKLRAINLVLDDELCSTISDLYVPRRPPPLDTQSHPHRRSYSETIRHILIFKTNAGNRPPPILTNPLNPPPPPHASSPPITLFCDRPSRSKRTGVTSGSCTPSSSSSLLANGCSRFLNNAYARHLLKYIHHTLTSDRTHRSWHPSSQKSPPPA